MFIEIAAKRASGMIQHMSVDDSRTKVLHVWDLRLDSGRNIDDFLETPGLQQRAISRVLVSQGPRHSIQQTRLHELRELLSPFPKNPFLRIYSKARFRFLLKREIQQFRPDVIFYHFGQTAATWIPLSSSFNIPYVVGIYGHDISVALKQKRWQKKYRVFANSKGNFLVLANDVRRRMMELGVSESRIFSYNYPLDATRYFAMEKKPKGPIFKVTIPGRLVEKKGHIYLFKAIQLLKNRNIPVKVTVIGYGGDRDAYRLMARDCEISDQVEWIDTSDSTIRGGFDDLYLDVLSTTDLVVLPCITSSEGDNEAGPALVLCLAQAAEVPVLTTAFEGHEVSISDGETGLISLPGDPEDIANKIEWSKSNPSALAKIAAAGRDRVREVFDQDVNVGKIREVIELTRLKN